MRAKLFSIFFVVIFSGVAFAADEHDAKLSEQLKTVLHRKDTPELKVVARIVEVKTGRELYAENADEPVMPASNMKLQTSSTALDTFGSKKIWKTWLAKDGDDLWLIGSGDPAPGDSKLAKSHKAETMTMLDEWADALKKKGIDHVKGNLYYFDGVFEATQIHPTWSKSYLEDWYAAPVAGLNFNDNCVDISVKPAKDGAPAEYAVIPPVKNIEVRNKITSGADGDATTKPEAAKIGREGEANVYTLSGAATKPTDLESKSVTDPGAFFADALRTHLESKGIKIDGETKRAEKPLNGKLEPSEDKIVAVHETPMTDIMWRINKSSQNLFAECMVKAAGREFAAKQGRDEPGSWANGEEAVKAFLTKQGIDTTGLVVADGSGLSRANRVTARIVSGVLLAMKKHPESQAFFDSLSVAGEDGTLAKRMKDIKGHVFGKTGFIGGVRACSGYAKTKGGEWLVFSIIYNGIDGGVAPYEVLQDEAIHLLVDYPEQKLATTTVSSTK